MNLILALLFSVFAGSDPGELHLEADRPVLLQGQSFDLIVRSTHPAFSGEVVLEGVSDPRTVRLETGSGKGR